MEGASKLTKLQIEMLKVFSYDLTEQQLQEIKVLLSDYFAKNATAEMDKLWEDNNWNNKTIKEWSQEHMRTSYDE